MYGDEDVAELLGKLFEGVVKQYGGVLAFNIYLADMTIGEDAYNMAFDNTQEASAVLDEARFLHREGGICPHYATLYVVSGLHFVFVKKRVSWE